MRGPPLHPSWAERDDINRGPPRPALSTPSAPPQPAHRRPPLLPNCPNNLPGNLKPSSGQTTLSRIPPGLPIHKSKPFCRCPDENYPLSRELQLLIVVASFATCLTKPAPFQSSTQSAALLPILHLHQLPSRMEIHHGRRTLPTNRKPAARRWRRCPGSCCLAPTCWRHLLGQPGNFVEEGGRKAPATAFAGIPLHFADCRDNCRLPGHYFGDGCVPQILGESI